MMTMLGQMDKVQPTFLHQAVLLAIGLIGGAAGVASIIGVFLKKKRQIEPQPLEVRAAAEFVTRDFCARQHEEWGRRQEELGVRVERLREVMSEDKTSFEANASRRSAGIYQKIDEVRKELTEANEETRKQMVRGFQDLERAIGRLEGKLDGEG